MLNFYLAEYFSSYNQSLRNFLYNEWTPAMMMTATATPMAMAIALGGLATAVVPLVSASAAWWVVRLSALTADESAVSAR